MVFIASDRTKHVLVDTDNTLSLNEIKKLTGHNQSDEVIESLKITLANLTDDGSQDKLQIKRKPSNSEGVKQEIPEALKNSIKIFLQSPKPNVLKEALDLVGQSTGIRRIDSLVLACKLEPSSVLSSLQEIWKVVEELTSSRLLTDVGVCDVDTDVFIALYHWAKVKPRIIQINLAVCCVVPPILQDFCKQNNVQLLTHSDPLDILPRTALGSVITSSEDKPLCLDWVIRYLSHIQDRGVLYKKGYLVSLSRSQ